MEPETYVAETDNGQVLITVCEDGTIYVAFRDTPWDTWGIPFRANPT